MQHPVQTVTDEKIKIFIKFMQSTKKYTNKPNVKYDKITVNTISLFIIWFLFLFFNHCQHLTTGH